MRENLIILLLNYGSFQNENLIILLLNYGKWEKCYNFIVKLWEMGALRMKLF